MPQVDRTAEAVCPFEGGLLSASSSGIRIKPWFSRESLTIAWENVYFIHPIPFTRWTAEGWETYRGERLTASSLAAGMPFYSIEMALHDRHVIRSCSWIMRTWLATSLLLKPLFMATDEVHPTQGVLRLPLKKRWVRKDGESLLSLLDVFRHHSRFDHLFTED